MTVDTKIQYSRMAGRLIDHVANGTTDWAEGTMEVPSTEYTDAEQWQREMECIFKSLPILVGVTQEIPNPGDFRSLEILGILLITGGRTGHKVLMNVCTTAVCSSSESCGNQVVQLPYHGWTFKSDGALRAIADAPSLATCARVPGILCSSLPRKGGLIFAVLDAERRRYSRLPRCHDGRCGEEGHGSVDLCGSPHLHGPNWKVAYDGYLEVTPRPPPRDY